MSQATKERSEEAKSVGNGHQEIESVTIRFAGDSGDGMQVTGTQFSHTSAVMGNDLATFPDFPAEIRAPAGTLPGVSGFQLHFSSRDILTPGDEPDVLVAMNPAALKVNLRDLRPGGTILVDEEAFTEANLKKAGYEENPLEDGSLSGYDLIRVPVTTLTREAVGKVTDSAAQASRSRNMLALGILYKLYDRPADTTIRWIESKFGRKPEVRDANIAALKAGINFVDTVEIFPNRYRVPPADLQPGTYRSISGNQAAAMGFIAAAKLSGRTLFYAGYPITPASDILHDLAREKHFGVITMQAEDEIAAIGAAIGAAYGGHLGMCATSGPGVCLKGEAINLAVMTELPVVIVDVQRAGPSTGMPTKTEQSDLLLAMFGRNGESPVAVIAPATPADCFAMAIEAFRLATKYMTPVFYLSDNTLANGTEPWLLPDPESLGKIEIAFREDPEGFEPYVRNEKTLARPWAIPGTPGLEHRIGGIEKWDGSGNVSYDPDNHQKMCEIRAAKVDRIADDIPEQEVLGDPTGKVLVVGWGSTYGPITAAIRNLQRDGKPVSAIHLRYLNPFPRNLELILRGFEKILVPEMNLGQLAMLLRSRFLIDAVPFGKVKGRPFRIDELTAKIEEML